MSKVKIELPEDETKVEIKSEPQEGEPKNVQDLTGFVETLLQQMENCLYGPPLISVLSYTILQDKFQDMSDQIINRIDEMGARIDDLEKNIGEMMTQAGVDEPEK